MERDRVDVAGPAGEVTGAGVGLVVDRHGDRATHQGQASARLGIGDGGVVADEEAGARVGAEVVRVGGQRREQQEGAPPAESA